MAKFKVVSSTPKCRVKKKPKPVQNTTPVIDENNKQTTPNDDVKPTEVKPEETVYEATVSEAHATDLKSSMIFAPIVTKGSRHRLNNTNTPQKSQSVKTESKIPTELVEVIVDKITSYMDAKFVTKDELESSVNKIIQDMVFTNDVKKGK